MLLEAEAVVETAPHVIDRRRPGRMDATAALVPLLRNPAGSGVIEDDFDTEWAPREPAPPPRGFGLCVALCIPLWVAAGGLFYTFVS